MSTRVVGSAGCPARSVRATTAMMARGLGLGRFPIAPALWCGLVWIGCGLVKLGVAKRVDAWYVRPPHEAGRLVDNMDEPMLPDAALNGTAAIGTAEDPESTQRQGGTNDTGGGERGA